MPVPTFGWKITPKVGTLQNIRKKTYKIGWSRLWGLYRIGQLNRGYFSMRHVDPKTLRAANVSRGQAQRGVCCLSKGMVCWSNSKTLLGFCQERNTSNQQVVGQLVRDSRCIELVVALCCHSLKLNPQTHTACPLNCRPHQSQRDGDRVLDRDRRRAADRTICDELWWKISQNAKET